MKRLLTDGALFVHGGTAVRRLQIVVYSENLYTPGEGRHFGLFLSVGELHWYVVFGRTHNNKEEILYLLALGQGVGECAL